MIKKTLFLILSYLIIISVAKSDIINEIIIDGNKRVSDETIKVYGNFNIKDNITESDVNKIIRNLYSTNFFENVEISFSNNILKINLSEYPIINQLIIIGEKKKARIDQIKKLIRLKEKKSFIKSY